MQPRPTPRCAPVSSRRCRVALAPPALRPRPPAARRRRRARGNLLPLRSPRGLPRRGREPRPRLQRYGFVSFASRAAARRALREAPHVTVAGVPVSVQIASAGPDPPSGGGGGAGAGRRVYVTNVAPDASAERLRAFFARFGELEGGPFGFDAATGASRGYALFGYQAAVGAATAVQEPYRVFEGRTLHCQLANEPARKTKAPPAVVVASAAGTPPRRAVQSVLDAAEAAGVVDLAAYARDPAQAAALLGENPALAAAALSAALASGDAAVPLTPAAVSEPMEAAAASPKPATAVTVAPSPVMVGVRPSGGAGLLGKPPSLPVVSSSSGRKGTMKGT